MLSYQKNTLLGLLAQFKVKLLEYSQDNHDEIGKIFFEPQERLKIIDNNLTSIEKQIKRL